MCVCVCVFECVCVCGCVCVLWKRDAHGMLMGGNPGTGMHFSSYFVFTFKTCRLYTTGFPLRRPNLIRSIHHKRRLNLVMFQDATLKHDTNVDRTIRTVTTPAKALQPTYPFPPNDRAAFTQVLLQPRETPEPATVTGAIPTVTHLEVRWR